MGDTKITGGESKKIPYPVPVWCFPGSDIVMYIIGTARHDALFIDDDGDTSHNNPFVTYACD